MAAKTIRYAADPRTGVARGLYVNFGVADHHRLCRLGAEFSENRFDAHGVRFLRSKLLPPYMIRKFRARPSPCRIPRLAPAGMLVSTAIGIPERAPRVSRTPGYNMVLSSLCTE